MEFIGAKPASVADAQSVLRPDEALITFTFGDDEAYLFVVRKGQAKFFTLPVKRSDVVQLIAAAPASICAQAKDGRVLTRERPSTWGARCRASCAR